MGFPDFAIMLPADKSQVVEFNYVRELSEADALLIQSGACPATKPTAIQEVRDRHHWIAKLVADGISDIEISAIVGMSPGRVGVLRNDPAFIELVSHYTEVRTALGIDITQRLSYLSGAVTQEMARRLEESPEEISNKDLIKLGEVVLDRSGHGASSTVHVKTTDTVAFLKELRAKSEAEKSKTVISREEEITIVANDKISAEGPVHQPAELHQ